MQGAVGSISIGKDLGSLLPGAVRVFVVGSSPTDGHPSIAFKSLTIGGNVLNADIRGGSSVGASNPDAQIGTVKVKGDWTASSLSAGVLPGVHGFGTAADAPITQAGEPDAFFSKIASITIGGNVEGTAGGTDRFGFVAQEIGALRIHGVAVKLTAGRSNDTSVTDPAHLLGTTGDVVVHEV